ncbi:MAG TPA: hypothetical protein VG502_21665 [Flexivirga sp.]|uniref:hypothetical protein n=1 Tax=Flexivirga sp. TaxID=1962927 RepID=UPI002B674C01|nr:hypothetical protein [Flexivirga sp.]HWC24916.1 hypothetical protein [Flexivirga sp.]
MTPRHQAQILETAALATEHAWVTESRHPTSLGVVLYVRCADCGARRVDLHEARSIAPEGISRPV